MKKIAGIAAGVVVAVGVISTAGAWYTGTQLPGVLQNAIAEANQQSQDALLGTGITGKLELVSLESRLFTSTARYRLSLDMPATEEAEARHLEVLFVDDMEHGPLPISRLKRLNLWPVMAASNYALEANELTQKWFDAAKGAAPLTGQGTLGYDLSTSGTLVFTPLDFAPTPTSTVTFSGMTLDVEASKHARQVVVNGSMDSLLIQVADTEQTPVKVELRGLTVTSDQHQGSGDFYLGDSNLKLATLQLNMGDKPPVLARDLSQFGSLQESGGLLAGRFGYDLGMVSYDGKDVAGMHMLWSMKNLDAGVVQSLIELYRDKLKPIQNAQAQDEEAPDMAFTPAEEERLKGDFEKLLSAKPQIALENYSIKTRSGEAALSLFVDLNKPESFELPAPELAKQLIAQLDAKLSIDKAMIGDGVRVQAQFEGQTDAKAIEDQATMLTEMGSGMALGTGLLTLEGDALKSSLHYANDKVTFNGQDMTVEEFAMFVMAKANGLTGGVGGDDQPEGYAPDDAYPDDGLGDGLEQDDPQAPDAAEAQ